MDGPVFKKCDRCTKFYKPYETGPLTYRSNLLIFAEEGEEGSIEWRQFDLCEDCMKEACRFMKAKLS